MRDTLKIAILEDEIPARKKLRRFLEELDTPVDIVAEMGTVAEGIAFLQQHTVDLVFSDIALLDGNSFDIYQQVPLSCPIIFTTAYDQFWMKAFESNGIDYLLKPFSKERFQKAWDKFMRLDHGAKRDDALLSNLAQLIAQHLAERTYKKRFAAQKQQSLYFLDVEKIAFFEAHENVVFAFDTSGKKHLLSDSTLKEIEEQLNPADFFRINRSELVSKQHVERMERFDKNTLAIKMKGFDKYLRTSQGSTASFRKWMDT